ncbi:thiol-disulfide oxidoreductase [Methylacidiphilum sp. Yel]|uniref:thiol-disulfide oxidoreductase DCC family protein n=1 Tax=Methylacidiphilum sp. Yel TaxID=1847730 RepID=UPI00106B0706|nr:DCC1-like thiol-disulfide oxidoreductase family protein [Methylacidiphilum sp. Yel]TFE70254.1 thiol-disulfide oxidoreductase [Methylacidiphilum sp. Yel]
MDFNAFISEKKDKQIIFFDGICVLCNSFVSFVLRKDKKHSFLFAPRQGKLFEKFQWLMSPEAKIADSIVLCRYNAKKHTWEFFIESQAVVEILKSLTGFYLLGLLLSFFPTSFLNKLYRLIAKNRYKLFGKEKNCRFLNQEERKYFFD